LFVIPGLLVSGFVVFAPKFVESQFGVTAAWAAQLIGMLWFTITALIVDE